MIMKTACVNIVFHDLVNDGYEMVDIETTSNGLYLQFKKYESNKEPQIAVVLRRDSDGLIQLVRDSESHFKNTIYSWIFPLF